VAVLVEEQSTTAALMESTAGRRWEWTICKGWGYIVALAWGEVGLCGVTEQSCYGTCTHGALQPRQVLRMTAAGGLHVLLRCVVRTRLSEPSWRENR
jgi:hypothetical protein